MARGRASVYPYKTKKGTRFLAQVSFTLDGKRELVRKTFATEKEALDFVLSAKAIKDLPQVIKDARTLEDVLKELEKHGSHWHTRHRAYHKGVAKDLPQPISEITVATLNEYKVSCLDKGNSPTTINKKINSVSKLLNEAERMGWIEKNPCRHVARLKPPQGRDRILNAEERARLLAECKASKTKGLYPLVVLALCTGARKGELLALDWKDVDKSTGRIVLRHTKNGRPRGLMLPKKVIAMLPRGKNLVFEGLGEFKNAWRYALERAKITGFRFHDLRHTAISELVRQGLSMPQIMAISGHLTTQMCKRYQHHDVADTAAPLAALAAGVVASSG
jgi:integrase